MAKGDASSPVQGLGPGVNSREQLVSQRILILANLLRRSAAFRYRRLLGLAGVEWGLVAHLGLGMPQTLNQMAGGMGLEKAQLSRAVSTLVKRGLVSKKINPHNNREVLISLTREGQRHHRMIQAAGEAANQRMLANFPRKDLSRFVEQLKRLTHRARELLQSEQTAGGGRDVIRPGTSRKRPRR